MINCGYRCFIDVLYGTVFGKESRLFVTLLVISVRSTTNITIQELIRLINIILRSAIARR